MDKNKESQIEFINEEDLDFLGGAKDMIGADNNVCGNLRECGWNSQECPKLEKCS